MNKKIVLMISILAIFTIVMVPAISALFSYPLLTELDEDAVTTIAEEDDMLDEIQQVGQTEQTEQTEQIEQIEQKEEQKEERPKKEFNLLGEKITATYHKTRTIKENDGKFGSNDEYLYADASNNVLIKYSFQKDSDFLIGYSILGQLGRTASDWDIPTIEEEEAKKVAEEFLINLYGKEDMDKYTYESTALSNDNMFNVYFYRYINDIRTDDRISIRIEPFGLISSFYRRNPLRYEEYADLIDDTKVEVAKKAIIDEIESANILEYNIEDIFISNRENGEPCLVYFITYFYTSNGISIIKAVDFYAPLLP